MTRDQADTQFFGKTFDEALNLLVETRAYVAGKAHAESDRLPPASRLRFALESMRVTSRLSHIMAWLLTQKAVHAGELTWEEALRDCAPLSEQAVCLDDREELAMGLPGTLCDLLARSRALYVRVSRLDELVRRAS